MGMCWSTPGEELQDVCFGWDMKMRDGGIFNFKAHNLLTQGISQTQAHFSGKVPTTTSSPFWDPT
jgi:hypothetical protein